MLRRSYRDAAMQQDSFDLLCLPWPSCGGLRGYDGAWKLEGFLGRQASERACSSRVGVRAFRVGVREP